MVKFIKLTHMIINSTHINKILIKDNKYYIHVLNNNIGGFMLFSSGSISSQDDVYEVCPEREPLDYKIVSDWINRLD